MLTCHYCLGDCITSTAAFLVLWFWVVHRELRARTDTVNSAVSQLAACRKNTYRPGTALKRKIPSAFLPAAWISSISL
jgi:hypothetical protein